MEIFLDEELLQTAMVLDEEMEEVEEQKCSLNKASYSAVQDQNRDMGMKEWPLWEKVCVISIITILTLAFLIFLAVWVVFPLIFMNSISLQTTFMFFPVDQPKHPQFDNPEMYGIDGVMNFYLTVKDTDGSTPVIIGTWLITHEDEKAFTAGRPHNINTAEEILRRTTKPVVIYMHGVACNRILPNETYAVARREFLVLAMDHRGYGDSGLDVTMCETGIVSDTRQIFKWVRSLTSNDIYFWGHSMGTALSTHTVRSLKEQDGIVPTGLILESAFTTMREEIVNNPLGKMFSWLLYFNATILEPLERNGFLFKTTENILSVDCPIMMMHAEDDNVIPWRLGFKLYQVAKTQRNLEVQGSVNFTLFPSLGYYHIGITRDKKVPKMIQDFKLRCQIENKRRDSLSNVV